MPADQRHPEPDFSKFDDMSTEELNEILRQDFLSPETEESDEDAINYIMEVITRREGEEGRARFTPVDEAWKRFNEYYRPESGNVKSLYDFSDEDMDEEDSSPSTADTPDTVPAAADAPPAKKTEKSPTRRHRSIIRVAVIAAALLVIVFAGSLTAYAFGFDLWGAVSQWTKETFGFDIAQNPSLEESMYPRNNDPRTTLSQYGIENVVPNWMPEGYEYVDIEATETPKRRVFRLHYESSSSEIMLSVVLLYDEMVRTYEKDDVDVICHESNGIEHYIVRNGKQSDSLNIVWISNNCECLITGEITVEEAEKMIDSIYMGR